MDEDQGNEAREMDTEREAAGARGAEREEGPAGAALRGELEAAQARVSELEAVAVTSARRIAELEAALSGAQLLALEGHQRYLLAVHADVVPELVQGSTVAELDASLEPAREAFAAVRRRTLAELQGGLVPAGNGARHGDIAGLERMSPLQKIAHALKG